MDNVKEVFYDSFQDMKVDYVNHNILTLAHDLVLTREYRLIVLHFNESQSRWFCYFSSMASTQELEIDSSLIVLMKIAKTLMYVRVHDPTKLMKHLGYCAFCPPLSYPRGQLDMYGCFHYQRKKRRHVPARLIKPRPDQDVFLETTMNLSHDQYLCGPISVVLCLEYQKYASGLPNRFDELRHDEDLQVELATHLLDCCGLLADEINQSRGMAMKHEELGLLAIGANAHIRVFEKTNKFECCYSSPSPTEMKEMARNGYFEKNHFSPSYHEADPRITEREMSGGMDEEQFVYLLWTKEPGQSGHYDPVFRPKKLFQPKYHGRWCHWCNRCVSYGDEQKHQCSRACNICNTTQCLAMPNDIKMCDACNKWVRNETCFFAHQHNDRCLRLPECLQCGKRIQVGRYGQEQLPTHKLQERIDSHRCGEKWCPSCRQFRLPNHRDLGECTIPQPKPRKSYRKTDDLLHPKLIFFDLETFTTQDNKELLVSGKRYVHQVNWAEAQYCNGERRTFRSIDKFCEWLFNFDLHGGYTVIAHNGKGYDFIFILRWIADNTNRPFSSLVYDNLSTIQQGTKITSLTLTHRRKKIRFIDSLNFFGCSLSKLPATFQLVLPEKIQQEVAHSSFGVDIPEAKGIDHQDFCSKGYFPYSFCNPLHYGYEGPVPDQEWFTVDRSNPKKTANFEHWWNHLRNIGFVWNLERELEAYCRIDVDILRLACLRFRELMMEATTTEQAPHGVDPFLFVTIASYVMHVYTRSFMPEKSIALYSSVQSSFFRRALSGGRTNCVQLWDNTPHKKFYYDVVSLYPSVQFDRPYPVGSPEDIFQPSQNVYDYLKEDWLSILEVDLICPKDLHIPILPETIVPTLLEIKSNGERVEREATQKKLLFSLLDKKNYVTNSVELSRALQHGYRVTKIHRVSLWRKTSKTLFRDYVATFYKIKTACGGWPKHVKTPEEKQEWLDDVNKSVGIDLKESDIKKNPGMKFVSKLCLNSLWGKFCQRNNLTQNRWLQNMDDFLDFRRDVPFYKAGGTKIANSIYPLVKLTEHIAYASWKPVDSEDCEWSKTTSVPIGVFTTAHARMVLYDALHLLGRRVLYFDTDSVIFYCEEGETPKDLFGEREGVVLGRWESELKPGHWIDQFGSLGPKTYFYRVTNEKGEHVKHETRAKGFTLKNMTSKDLYHLQRELVVNRVHEVVGQRPDIPELPSHLSHMLQNEYEENECGEPIPVESKVLYPTTTFDRDRFLSITTRKFEKTLRVTSDKRVWVPNLSDIDAVRSLPYGHSDLIE